MTRNLEQSGRGIVSFALRIVRAREFMVVMIILAAGAALAIKTPIFLTWLNLHALLLGLSIESIVAIGMMILMVSGGFDLSVGSTAALSGAVAAMCLKSGMPAPVAVAAGLAIGAIIGLSNGLIITKIGINPFVTTLGMMSVVRGGLMVVTDGQNISANNAAFKWIGQGEIAGIQAPILIAVALVILGDLLLRKSRFFRQSYYIGGNEKAAHLSGIPVNSIKTFNYVLIGLLAALAGVIMTARYGNASVTTGEGLELRVITAVIIGGASLQGGEGTVLGSFLGLLLMSIINNALTLLGVGTNWTTLVIGATLLVAVMIDTLGKRYRVRS
ncbi:MAG: ABC transporter permease [Candidatus Sumerlaeota bacterium]|nr:ABC transporter permease [Candidatus Sumerlaeota bacterium]